MLLLSVQMASPDSSISFRNWSSQKPEGRRSRGSSGNANNVSPVTKHSLLREFLQRRDRYRSPREDMDRLQGTRTIRHGARRRKFGTLFAARIAAAFDIVCVRSIGTLFKLRTIALVCKDMRRETAANLAGVSRISSRTERASNRLAESLIEQTT